MRFFPRLNERLYVFYVYIDGKKQYSYDNRASFTRRQDQSSIGGNGAGGNISADCCVDDFCVMKGLAYWQSDFNPPTDYLLNVCNIYIDNVGAAWGMDGGSFSKLHDNWETLSGSDKKALLLSTNYKIATLDELKSIVKFKIVAFAATEDMPKVSIKAIPKDQLVTPKGLISLDSFEGIDKATLTSTVSGNGACKLLVTNDLATYQTYDFDASEWKVVDHTDLAAVKADGIDASQLQTIDRKAWDALTKDKPGIGFAYLMAIEDVADTCSVDKLDIQVDMRGSWDKAIHGTDYKYGYPANTALRVSLLSNGDYKINFPM